MTRFRHDLILRMIKLLDAVLVTIGSIPNSV